MKQQPVPGQATKCLTGNGEKLTDSPAAGCNWLCLAGVYFPSLSCEAQSWGRSLIFDLKIKDPSDFADLYDDLDHTRGSDLIDGDLDQKITL